MFEILVKKAKVQKEFNKELIISCFRSVISKQFYSYLLVNRYEKLKVIMSQEEIEHLQLNQQNIPNNLDYYEDVKRVAFHKVDKKSFNEYLSNNFEEETLNNIMFYILEFKTSKPVYYIFCLLTETIKRFETLIVQVDQISKVTTERNYTLGDNANKSGMEKDNAEYKTLTQTPLSKGEFDHANKGERKL